MTKNTKTLLTIGGIAVVGYILWKQGVFGGKKSANFSNLVGDSNFYCPKGYVRVQVPSLGGSVQYTCVKKRLYSTANTGTGIPTPTPPIVPATTGK